MGPVRIARFGPNGPPKKGPGRHPPLKEDVTQDLFLRIFLKKSVGLWFGRMASVGHVRGGVSKNNVSSLKRRIIRVKRTSQTKMRAP